MFTKHELTEQERSKDPNHTKDINNLKKPNHGITKEMIMGQSLLSNSNVSCI